MASTTVGLIYSASTGRLRWWVIPDDDSQIANFVSPNPGEAALIVSQAQYQAAANVAGLQALVNAVSGKAPDAEDRYVDIDAGGNIAAVSFACPNCGDVAPSGVSRVQHANAEPGGFFVGSSYFAGRSAGGSKERLKRRRFHRKTR